MRLIPIRLTRSVTRLADNYRLNLKPDATSPLVCRPHWSHTQLTPHPRCPPSPSCPRPRVLPSSGGNGAEDGGSGEGNDVGLVMVLLLVIVWVIVVVC